MHKKRVGWLVVLGTVIAGLLALGACAPLTVVNALVPSSTYELRDGIAYGAGNRQTLDVYRPTVAPQSPSGWPVVVFFYGGTWTQGNRADYKFVGEAMASRGYLTLVADYRLYPEVRFPDFLRDSATAVGFALEHSAQWGGDPRKVFVMGHSAGAYNAAMVALDARQLQAVGHSPSELAGWIGLAGPYDFLPIENPEAQLVFHHPDYPPGTQPIDFVSPQSPPAFLGAARSDNLVNPHRNSGGLAKRLQAAQVPVSLRYYDRVNHVTLAVALAPPARWLAPVLDDMDAFLAAPRSAAALAAPTTASPGR
ncbi:MAG: alpha/beta hydrolase [Pseudomonadota bacterium]